MWTLSVNVAKVVKFKLDIYSVQLFLKFAKLIVLEYYHSRVVKSCHSIINHCVSFQLIDFSTGLVLYLLVSQEP